jgi:hypothetical protein
VSNPRAGAKGAALGLEAADAGEGAAGRVASAVLSAAGAGGEFWAWSRDMDPAQTKIATNNNRFKAGANAGLDPGRVKQEAN